MHGRRNRLRRDRIVYSAFVNLAIGPLVGLLATLLINEKRYVESR